ncbi:MAG TPA: hypothetical protein DCY48_02625 [Candidatus Magasanikbacteria bacterium]|uniref:Uncharacterized protein n=1 Tax=Candidatus Magasanikbacteria bacterium GW2011_GWA2_46_17 TaxID=1619042 RepID=A0A0G1S0S3_9BACT|nr:MAG: hypothetical protein UX39_C0006G0022 [Candidatus Magasanikbacteria bacterium GW2011_GWA2_46_17]OGH77680.1 MAG: hypothetical protein A3I74_02895 [Candidatus Magasanikbacteria bacterium RIFCSPLOWO2_02_FULL_47_16]OGH79561.1 MAG: hypothetical protein A3C10_00510 [Candidatus Magasanikbacteria bacterium RIFCSPHIGHO2_02_FULL_48_18]OGH83288.1 MAG: hypothetical protein A3G08_04165 [Candidatus Magasanikbacteria bacterium RIFCSPLOWO2_12_FULL_47_9b]HAZ28647.1 hypothetical protein [Candidatus Magasa
MSIETEASRERKSFLERERTMEVERAKEGQEHQEGREAAAMERADILVREVKNTKKQMQNILLHVQDVLQAIRALRGQLELAETAGDPMSIVRDKAHVASLKAKLSTYQKELRNMRGDLLREQKQLLREQNPVTMWTEAELNSRAERLVIQLLHEAIDEPRTDETGRLP